MVYFELMTLILLIESCLFIKYNIFICKNENFIKINSSCIYVHANFVFVFRYMTLIVVMSERMNTCRLYEILLKWG